MADEMVVLPIGWVESPLTDLGAAPCQGDEGAPECWLVFDPGVQAALDGLQVGDDIVVITWLHRADRTVRQVHPRSDPNRPLTGVFATRSPDRPNPLGLHVVTILEHDDRRIRVRDLEAIDGTPIVAVGSQTAWRIAIGLPAALQISHRNGGSAFSSPWRIL